MFSISEFTHDFFRDSSNQWMSNKVKRGHSMAYKCESICKDGNQCSRYAIMKDGTSDHCCKQHINKASKIIRDGSKSTENHIVRNAKRTSTNSR